MYTSSPGGHSPQGSDGGGSVASSSQNDDVVRRDSGGSNGSRPGSGRIHRPSVAQMMLNREDRKSKRMTASLGSMFVFDTCKPSDLKSAMEEMETDNPFGDDDSSASGFGDGGALPSQHSADLGAFGRLDDVSSFGFDSFSAVPSVPATHSSPFSSSPSTISSTIPHTISQTPVASHHSPQHTSSSPLPHSSSPSGHHAPSGLAHFSSSPLPSHTPPSDMSNHQLHNILTGSGGSVGSGIGERRSSSQSSSNDSLPPFKPPSRPTPAAPHPLSVQTTMLGGSTASLSSPTRSPGSPQWVGGPSSPSSATPSAFSSSTPPPTSGGFFTPPFQPQYAPQSTALSSQLSPPNHSDEFEYYAAEQLDALIDFLDVGAEMLVEDDQGLTDWLRDDNFAQFEFNPEWLELTLTMKPTPTEDDGSEGSTPSSTGEDHHDDPFSKSTSNNTLQSRRATVATNAAASPSVGGLTSNAFSSSSPSGASSLGNISPLGNNAPMTASSVKLPLRGQNPTPPSTSTQKHFSPPSGSSLDIGSPLSQLPIQDRPRPPSVPDSQPHPIGTLSQNLNSNAGNNASPFSSPFDAVPSQAPKASTNANNLLGSGNVSAFPGPGASSFALPNSSPFLLPTAIAQGQVAPRSGKSLPKPTSSSDPSPKSSNGKSKKKVRSFPPPLISSPGMGETAITVSASIFRVLRMMDPERPFESMMHDSGALTSSDLSISLSPSIHIPPSAGSSQQTPPSFTVQVAIIAPFWEGLQCLFGLTQGKSTSELLDLLPSASSVASSFASPLTSAAIISSRTKPGGAPTATTGASNERPNSPFSSTSSTAASAALNKNNCLTYSEWKGYPPRHSTEVQGVPHVLISTIAIVNDQGRTKRLIKLVALAMTPTDAVPNIPTGTTQLRRPTEPVGGLDPILGLDPHSASILSAISSAHGTVFVMPPSTKSSTASQSGSSSPPPPSSSTLSASDIEDYQQHLRLYQKLNYQAGPIKGNPHVRVLLVGKKEAKIGTVLQASSSLDNGSLLDPSQRQIAFILDSALKWAQQQGIGVMKTKSEAKWLTQLKALPSPSASSLPPSIWYPHPLLSHMAAQTHALRMEALMTSFDHIQKVKAQTSVSSSAVAPSQAKAPSNVPPKASSAKSPLTTSGHVKSSSIGSSFDSSRATVAGTSALGVKVTQSSTSSSNKRSSAFGPSPSLGTSQNKPLVNKRIIAVIGLQGSGRTSIIKRACHARYSRINAASGSAFDPSSTFMMSTLSPMTSTFGTTTLNGGTSGSNPNSASSFADVFFNTQRCRIEFVETPSRSTDKIQFYKDINRAHAFIFVYAGVHPSPSEIAEMQQSINDIWQAKRQQPLSGGSAAAASSSALSRLNALQPNASPSSTSSSSVFSSNMMRRLSTVNDIPIIVLGTQAPHRVTPHASITNNSADEQPSATSDPSMMSLTQLLARYNGLAHFAVDTAPVQDPALARALQWLYNRIGEETLSLKGVRATNRPHHSGSVSGATAPRPLASSSGSTGSNSITSVSGFSGSSTPPNTISPANSRKVLLPNSSPSSSRISTIVGNNSGVSVPAGTTRGADSRNTQSSSPGLQSGLSTSNLGKAPTNGNGNNTNSSIAVFMKVEALVVKMRTGVASTATPGASATRPHPPLMICDRRLENGAWIAIPGSATTGIPAGSGSGSPASTSPHSGPVSQLTLGNSNSSLGNSSSNLMDDSFNSSSSSSSKKKQKILQRCFVGNEAVAWVVNAIVKPETSTSGSGASGSYLPSPSQMKSEALGHLQQLLDLSVIRCIWSDGMEETSFSSQSKFQDSHDAIYRFQMDEDNESVLNMRKVWIGEVDHSEIEQLATWLFQKVQPFIVALSSISGDSSGGNNSASSSGMIPSTGSSNNLAVMGADDSASSTAGEHSNNSSSSSTSNLSSSNLHSSSSSGPRTFVIDGEGFKRSPHFGDLLLFSAKLQRIKVDRLTRAQKIAFWINVYNILSIHVAIQHGYVGKSKSKRKWLYLKTFYQIDGALFSLDEIFHGILRGNRKNPNTGKVPFKPNDPRRKLALHDDSSNILSSQVYSNSSGASALPTASMGSSAKLPPFDARIHFALTCLSRTSPSISPMRADTLDAQLNALTTTYLESHLELDFKRSTLSLPSSLLSFRADFNKAPAPFLAFLASFLEPEKAKNINFLANKIKEKDIKARSDDATPSAPRFR